MMRPELENTSGVGVLSPKYLTMTPKPGYRVTFLVMVLTLLIVSGCGSSERGAIPGNAIATVDGTPITRTDLRHWTATFVRGDYFAVTRKKAPAGLASDPPDYGMCVAVARTISAHATGQNPPLNDARLSHDCHALYKDAELEALGFLITVLWSIGQSAEKGYRITETNINEQIAQLQREDYPKPGQFDAYLINKGWSRADLRYIVKRNLLVGEISQHLMAEVKHRGGGELALGRLFAANSQRWTAKTTCRPEYVVLQCREYKGASPNATPPAVIFERWAAPRG